MLKFQCLFLHWIEVNPMVESVRLPILFNEPSGTDLVIAVGLLNSTSRPIRLSKQERGDCRLVLRRLLMIDY